MAEQREYEDYRRGGRREWNANDEPQGWGGDRAAGSPRGWRSQGDGDNYSDDGFTFGPGQSSGYGRGSSEFGGRGSFERGRGWQEPEPWQGSPSFGGQRGYARDLYSDSGIRRHETDWESGSAGRGMQSVYSGTGGSGYRSGFGGYRGHSNFGDTYGSTFGRYEDASGDFRVRSGFAGRGPKDYQRSDERIREEISDRMTDDDSLDASDITIQVKQGEVTLTGTVHSREQKRRAEDLAESISGVREVTNSIRMSREQNGLDLNQSPSIQVGQPQGSKTGKSGTGGGVS